MNILTMEHMTKVFAERKILDDADFSIQDQEKVGILGVNGTGKSTLLSLIAGKEEADEGKITLANHVVIRFLSQNPAYEEEDTVLETVIHQNKTRENEWSIEAEAKTILNHLKISEFDKKMKHLSGGQKKRVALASVLLSEADLLILDEPTNHLDNEMSGWLEDYLQDFRGAILLVTHDRYFLDRIVTRIVEIDKGKLYSYPGSYSEFIRLKEARQDSELAAERKRKSILKVELEWLARGARARSTKQKAHIARIEDMQKLRGPQDDKNVEMNSISSRLGKKTIEVEGLTKSYGERLLIDDFTYIFLKNDRIGIIGENGCGKSTLLKMILGQVSPEAGTIEIGETVKIGYFSQESEELDDSMRVIDYVKEAGEYVRTTDGLITAAQMLENFLFDGATQWNLIGKLSGGEKRRLFLLRILMTAPNVLILDEPTNDLDIQTLTILENYLDSFDGILITVSHDRYFLDRIVKRIFAFEGDGKLTQYEGNYSDYLLNAEIRERMSEAKAVPAKMVNEEKTASGNRKHERKLKFSFKEQREYETIEEDIEALESRCAELDSEIEASATNYGRLNELMQEKEETEAKIEEKMLRWEYLSDLAERIEKERAGK